MSSSFTGHAKAEGSAHPDEVADCNRRKTLLGKAYAVQGIGGQTCRRVTQQVYRDGGGHESIEPTDLREAKSAVSGKRKEDASTASDHVQVPVVLLDAVCRVVRAEDDRADDCAQLLGGERGDAGKHCQVSDFGQRGEAESISERLGEGDEARIRVESSRLDPRHGFLQALGWEGRKPNSGVAGKRCVSSCRKPMQGRGRRRSRSRRLGGRFARHSSEPCPEGSVQQWTEETDAAAFRLLIIAQLGPTLPRAHIPISATTGAMAPILSCHPGSLNAFALKLKRESAPGPSPSAPRC